MSTNLPAPNVNHSFSAIPPKVSTTLPAWRPLSFLPSRPHEPRARAGGLSLRAVSAVGRAAAADAAVGRL
eukprot:2286437-Pleurochrysis_carterae.AAC.1